MWVKVVATIISCISLSSCLFTVGVRELHWHGMKVRQEGSRSNPESISSFSQLYYRPNEATPIITIRMPNGNFIRSDKLSRDSLNTYLRNGLADVDQFEIIGVSYSRGHMALYLDDSGRMTMMIIDINSVYSHRDISGSPPAISIPDSERILEFPLKENELKELFGMPTKDETYLLNT